jgi:hypothetical protein
LIKSSCWVNSCSDILSEPSNKNITSAIGLHPATEISFKRYNNLKIVSNHNVNYFLWLKMKFIFYWKYLGVHGLLTSFKLSPWYDKIAYVNFHGRAFVRLVIFWREGICLVPQIASCFDALSITCNKMIIKSLQKCLTRQQFSIWEEKKKTQQDQQEVVIPGFCCWADDKYGSDRRNVVTITRNCIRRETCGVKKQTS